MAHTNFMLAMMKAVDKDQSTLSKAQITDAEATMLATKILDRIYAFWNGSNSPLNTAIAEIQKWAQAAKNAKGSDSTYDSQQVTYWQEKYSMSSSHAQSLESQQDGMVQSDQGQTSADASNLQMKAQMVQGINSVMTTLSNMLGKIVA